MATEAVENYLKVIHSLQTAGGHAPGPAGTAHAHTPAAVGDIAAALNVTAGTVTSMVKKLARDGLVRAERYGGVHLTAKGRRLALAVLRRHRLVEAFLVNTLGFDWSEVHEEAERLEHAISDKLLDRLDVFLGHPSHDPHGDPIPDPEGRTRADQLRTLAEVNAGRRVRVMRVTNQSASFLQFVAKSGIQPGRRLRVESRSEEAGTVQVKPDAHDLISLSQAAARALLVDDHDR